MSAKEMIQKFQNSKEVTTALLIALFLGLNYLSYGLYLRLDLSQEGQFRITNASKSVLRNLQDPIIVEAFFSSDVPPAFIQTVKNVKDFLQEYANASRGKLKLIFLDPDNDKEAKDRAASLGIQPTPVGQLDAKKQEFRSVYYAVALTFGEKTEVVQNVLQSRELEYELTARIRKMTSPGERRIGFLTNHGPFQTVTNQATPPWFSLRTLAAAVETFYGDIIEVDTASQDIPPEITVLLIVGPDRLSEIDRLRIDQFLMRGGNLIVSASPMNINFQTFMASVGNTEAQEFFRHYGIDIGSDVLMDLSPKGSLPWQQQIDFFTVQKIPYPFWIIVPRGNLSQESTITEGLSAIFLPYSSSIRVDNTILSAEKGFKVQFLAKTSGQTVAKQNFVFIDPRQMVSLIENSEETRAEQNVALYVRGKFPSYFANRTLPKDAPKDFKLQKEATNEASIVVIGSHYAFTEFPSVSVIRCRECIEANLNLLLSAIDVLNGMEELSQVRKKQKFQVSLRNLPPAIERLFTFLAYALPLSFLAVYGTRRVLKRRKLSREGKYVLGGHG